MNPELPSTPERNVELPTDIFNLEKLTPEQIAGLVSALGVAIYGDFDDSDSESVPLDSPLREVDRILASDVMRLVEHAPEKATELFFTLASTDTHTKCFATDRLAGPLVKHYADDLGMRQEVINRWLALLDDESVFTRELAAETLSNMVDKGWLVEGWLDEPTARFIDSRLEHPWKFESWPKRQN